MAEFIFRFFVGGAIVSLFSALGEVVKPKSFAGLFGAAPSIALATLGLTITTYGKSYAATEGRSMIGGAAAMLVYACMSSRVMMRYWWHATGVASALIVVWLAVSFGVWLAFLR